MKRKSILIELLVSFSTEELSSFKRFLKSPYHNSDKNIIRLYDFLKSEVLDGQNSFDDTTRLKAYQAMVVEKRAIGKILNKEEYVLLRAKMSILFELAQQFLVTKAVTEDSVIKNQLLTRKILEKKQFSIYEGLVKKQEKELAKNQTKGIKYYKSAFQFEQHKMTYLYQNRRLEKEDNFPALHTNLDMYYLINKLDLYSTMYSIMNVREKEEPYDFVAEEAVSILQALPNYSNKPIIFIYKTIIQLIKTKDETVYAILLDCLDKHSATISKKDLIGIYHSAINFCIGQIREGKITYYTDILNLYKAMDKEEILMDKDFIDIIKLKNLIAASCRDKDFKWATTLVDKYCSFIRPKAIQKYMVNFYLGGIAFHQGKYEKAKDKLHEAEKGKLNPSIRLNCKILLAKSYYEIDKDYDIGTYRYLTTLENFTQNNEKLTSKSKKAYKNFIRILINLYRFRFKQGKQKLKSIRNKLEQMDLNSDKKWLLEKIVELE